MYDKDSQVAKLKRDYPHIDELDIIDELDMAMVVINERRNYEPTEDNPVDPKYAYMVKVLASEALAKRGAEGENQHSDNGVLRGYENGSSYSHTTLNQIIPVGTSFKR